MASIEKNRRNKVGIGLAANRPLITNSGVSPGDEYFASNTGEYSKCTLTAAGAKQWTTTALGQGIQVGTVVLTAGDETVSTATITASSRVYVSRQGAPGGGTAIGLLNVRAVTPGAPGSFIVEALAEANQAVVAADTSTVVWMVVG